MVTCTLCAFISLVWLREQIVHGGPPNWLEHNHQPPAPHQPDQAERNEVSCIAPLPNPNTGSPSLAHIAFQQFIRMISQHLSPTDILLFQHSFNGLCLPKEAPVDPAVAPEGPVLEPADAGEEAELDEEEEEDDDEEGEEEEEEEEEEGQQEEAADGNNGGQGEWGCSRGQWAKCMVDRGY